MFAKLAGPLTLAAESQGSPISALIWLTIPLIALVGGLAYAYWVVKLKRKFENRVNRSVGNFRKFQATFESDSAKSETSRPETSRTESGGPNQSGPDSFLDKNLNS